MRGHPRLVYFPCRLSLLPALLRQTLRPDIVLLHTSPPVDGAVSLGVEVNILPAAIEAARASGGLVVAQVNRGMPTTYGDAMRAGGRHRLSRSRSTNRSPRTHRHHRTRNRPSSATIVAR